MLIGKVLTFKVISVLKFKQLNVLVLTVNRMSSPCLMAASDSNIFGGGSGILNIEYRFPEHKEY